MRKLIPLFLSIILLISCQKKEEVKSCNGVWESIGHGQILEIKDSLSYAFFDNTSISCVPVRKSAFKEIESVLSLANDTLSLLTSGIIYSFTKSDDLPAACTNFLSNEKLKDPLYNFEVFMETVRENYAFLALNQIDWEDLYNTQKAKLTENSTAVDLYLLIEETFERLNDNHAFLLANDELYKELDQLPLEDDNNEELKEYGDFPVADLVAEHYLKEDMTNDSWLIKWGTIKDNIGYVQIKSMWLYANLDLRQDVVDSIGFVEAFGIARAKMFGGNYVDKEVQGVDRIMNKVMNDLADSESIVLDVRFNGGGQDLVSLKILSYFNSEKIHVASSKFRYGDQFTSAQPQYLNSNKNAYTKPVYVLTSPQSGSAAEMFSLATLQMSHVTRIGSATEGALSTTLDKKLPNGWEFCVSNEVYTDLNGKFYENEGIPVDYELHYPRERQAFFGYIVENLEKDKQDVLKAIEFVQSN